MNNLNNTPKFLYNAKCPFCDKVIMGYVDFVNYKEFTEKDWDEWDIFCEKGFDEHFKLSPCEHLAFYSDVNSLSGGDTFVQEKWKPQILKLTKGLDSESIRPLDDSLKLIKYLDEYLQEKCYGDEIEESIKENLPEYEYKIASIETNWENGPKQDYSADPFYFLIYLKSKN